VYEAGNAPEALEAFEQSLELRGEQADRLGETRALVGVCQALVAVGDVERAESLSRDLLGRAGGDPRTEHFGHTFLGDCALIRGDFDEAETRYREALRSALPLGDVLETSAAIQGVAMASAGNGDAHRAVRLAASVEALFESLGLWTSTPFWDELLAKHIGAAREALGAGADAVWAEGRAMALDDAISVALAPPETVRCDVNADVRGARL
jgi:tetratricopeptide (TPR) repeat protein